MAEEVGPTIKDITNMLNETSSSNKFTEKDIRDAVRELRYADSEGNYKFSFRIFLSKFSGHPGHLEEIKRCVIKNKSSEGKSSEGESSEGKTSEGKTSEGKTSEGKTKKKRIRRRKRRSASSKAGNK